MLALGAKGVISVASNIVPQVMATLCAAALSGDFFTARAIHEAYAGLFDTLFYEVNPIPVKPRADARLGFRPASSAALPDGGGNAAKLQNCLESLQLL